MVEGGRIKKPVPLWGLAFFLELESLFGRNEDHFNLRLPNLNIHNIFVEYFNEIYHIDVSTRYAELMQTLTTRQNFLA